MAMATKKDPAYYRDLQERSMVSRIGRHFEVQFRLLPGGQLPFRKRDTDAGFDVAAAENAIVQPGRVVFIRTGLVLCSPPGYCFQFVGRSSINKLGVLVPSNLIDATYTGELLAALHNTTDLAFVVHQGDRIAQLVFLPILHPRFQQVEEFNLSPEARGQQGFGSSGRNASKPSAPRRRANH